ncbi:MAG: hypothetical protein H0V66_08030 [Bdellovibrionales bacterium]|nr:hypothetical protein [Bdellovibrionales bacterium]
MKNLCLLIALVVVSYQAMAESNHGVKTNLKYSKNAKFLADQVETQNLVFIPEDVTFPKGKQKAKFEKALAIMEEVMNSEEFKTKVIAYERRGVRSYQKNYLWSASTKLLSNEEIYQVIMNGDEKKRPDTKGEMNFNSWVRVCNKLQMATLWCRQVIGSTTPDSSFWIKLNWTFYKSFETHEMVANMVHEWIHLLGFLHGNERTEEEVPYVVGDIAGEVAKGILQREKAGLTPF